jgi:pimeloyl-ACP methyl ester carboxylesterase
MLRGICIPGLAMTARDLPLPEGVVALDNPEIGQGPSFGRSYALEEVAELHARAVGQMVARDERLVVCGMSMGGMIVAAMATEFRAHLPRKCQFHFLVTTPNRPENPSIPDELVASWTTVRRGNVGDFERILSPFFSPQFRTRHPEVAQVYYAYRARGGNGQSPSAFYRQMNAVRTFPAYAYFARLDPATAHFVGGAEDAILGPSHNRDLRDLCPDAQHTEVKCLGHMINIERPDIVRSVFDP